MRSRVIGLVAACLLLGPAPAGADKWPAPARAEASGGDYRVISTPVAGSAAQLRLERAGTVVYERAAANDRAPVQLLVSADGHVVTLDEWSHAGHRHALVIYDPAGGVVIDRRLEEVLTSDELATKVKRTVSSRWWVAKDTPAAFVGDQLRIPTIWGSELRFRLADGGQERDGKPFAVETDVERFHRYATKGFKGELTVELGEVHSDDGGVTCRFERRKARCRSWGDATREPSTVRFTSAKLAAALAASTAFEPRLNREAYASLPGAHWRLVFDVRERGASYGYQVLVAADDPLATVVETWRALAGM